MSDKSLWNTGEKPPCGNYACAQCGEDIAVIAPEDEREKELPECQKCGFTQWYKV